MYLFFVSSKHSETYPRVRHCAAKSCGCTQSETASVQRTSVCPARKRVGKHNDIHNFVQGNTNSGNFYSSNMLLVG